MMQVSTTLWLVSLLGLTAMFALDFVVVERRVHSFTTREASRWVAFYIGLALAFALFIAVRFGADHAKEFVAGWVTEYSLSVDNLFVFLVLMSSFSVPNELKHRVLLVGVAIAIVLRGILIAAGASAAHRFAGTFFIFGAFLLYTAIKVWGSGESEPDPEGNALVRRLERVLAVTRDYHGHALSIRIDGKRHVTPLFFVIVAVGTTDLLFALDSIPAVLGLTQVGYLVFAANAFALMGLRQLYFLLDGLLDRIVYLSKGLAVILGFIAVKLILEATHGVYHVDVPLPSIGMSLAVIAIVLATTVIVSLAAVRRDPSLVAHTGVADAHADEQRHKGEAIADITALEQSDPD